MNNAQAVFCTDQTKLCLCLLHDPDNQHDHCHCSGHVLHRPDPAQLWLGLTLCPGLSIRATSGHVYGDDHHAHHDDDGFHDYHNVNGLQASLSGHDDNDDDDNYHDDVKEFHDFHDASGAQASI